MLNVGLTMLAQQVLPMPPVGDDTGFFNVGKIIMMAVFVFVWGWPAGWICRDARRLSINAFMWGLLVAGSGAVGWLCWVMLPSFWLGFLFFLFLAFGGVLAYVMYRDTLVEPDERMLKPANILAAVRGEQQEGFAFELKVRLVTLQGVETPIPTDEQAQQVYQVFQDLLFDALWRRATDVSIRPKDQAYHVLFRIDGVINEYTAYDRKTGQAVVDCAKQVAGLDVNERRRPQQGRILAQPVKVDQKVGLDLESSGSTAGERLKIKVRSEEAKYTAEDLGLTETQLASLREVFASRKGLVVLSGMGGAGISTTLYALARSHDAFTQNIHSVEVRPLMAMDNITQNIYKSGGGNSFARLLQSASRREPDIILVDPCGEPETMKMIGEIVGSKGKKIFATMRASGVLSALSRTVRWLDNAETASQVLFALMYQRLVRKLCPACKEAYKPNPDTLRKLNLSSKTNVTFYRPPTQQIVDKKGNPILCPTCQGVGYLGRTAIYEVLVVADGLRDAIRTEDANQVKAAARKSGLRYWQEVAMEQVIAGVTSIQEIVRVSKDAEAKAKG